MFSRNLLASCRPTSKAGQRLHVSSRTLATVADASSTPQHVPASQTTGQKSDTASIIYTGVIVNRNPIITRTPTAFERAYYAYHSRIERALHNPFPLEFYFKSGSIIEGQFEKEEKVREREAFGRPVRRVEEWRRKLHEKDTAKTQKKPKAESRIVIPGGGPQPMPREHEADRTGDVHSLDRNGERNVYLLVKSKDERGKEVWRFPQGAVEGDELLHEAVIRDLRSEYGTGMDTWVVSRNPIGVYRSGSPPNSSPAKAPVFFYKAHIIQGQVRPDGKQVLDFAWLTKQEIKPRTESDYWDGVKDLLSDF